MSIIQPSFLSVINNKGESSTTSESDGGIRPQIPTTGHGEMQEAVSAAPSIYNTIGRRVLEVESSLHCRRAPRATGRDNLCIVH